MWAALRRQCSRDLKPPEILQGVLTCNLASEQGEWIDSSFIMFVNTFITQASVQMGSINESKQYFKERRMRLVEKRLNSLSCIFLPSSTLFLHSNVFTRFFALSPFSSCISFFVTFLHSSFPYFSFSISIYSFIFSQTGLWRRFISLL